MITASFVSSLSQIIPLIIDKGIINNSVITATMLTLITVRCTLRSVSFSIVIFVLV